MGEQSTTNQKAWLGITLVAIGGYFLLRNLDLIPSFLPYWLFGWETVMMVVGGAMLATGRREGAIFLVIGSFFLLPEIFYIPRFHFRDWWPLILIVIGVVIVIRRRDYHSDGMIEDNRDFFNNTSIFGGSNKSFTSKNFMGGKMTSVFGGSDVDFSEAALGQEEVVLDVFCLFGGNDIRVPNDWTVLNDSFVLFGGYDDNRKAIADQDPNKILRIKGSVIFGGMDVKGA